MNRERDVWAGVAADHLTADQKREASKAKEHLIELQRGRKMLQAPFETGDEDPKDFVISTLDGFKSFLKEGLAMAVKPTILAIETKGNSDLGKRKETPRRRRLLQERRVIGSFHSVDEHFQSRGSR